MSKPLRTYGKRRTDALPRTTMLFTPPPSSPPSQTPSSPTPIASGSGTNSTQNRSRIPLAPRDTNQQSTLNSFFTSTKRKRLPTPPPSSSPSTSTLSNSTTTSRLTTKKPKLTQLHFTQNSLRSCQDCGMSYVRGTDDATHQKHHARVVRGIPWNGTGRALGNAGNARLFLVDLASVTPRVQEILDTVDTVLSAPALPPAIRERCKLFLAIASDSRKSEGRKEERVVGVVVSQTIKSALRVLSESEDASGMVDSGGGVICDPTPLPTPLGIHRLFVVPAYRGTGLARALLDAAAEHTVYACAFDPKAGEVAFSQPTQSGRAVMEAWGGGAVRVFVDDERQL